MPSADIDLRGVRDSYRAFLRADGKQTVDGTPLFVRLFGNTTGDDPDGCWEHQGSTHPESGHSYIFDDGSKRRAHRVAYELMVGPIPDDLCVLHRCDNPPCVNPGHLWLGTQLDNIADRDAKGRQRNQWTGPMSDGPPQGLADALHLGGNGLVPQCAAEAWGQLIERAGLT